MQVYLLCSKNVQPSDQVDFGYLAPKSSRSSFPWVRSERMNLGLGRLPGLARGLNRGS